MEASETPGLDESVILTYSQRHLGARKPWPDCGSPRPGAVGKALRPLREPHGRRGLRPSDGAGRSCWPEPFGHSQQNQQIYVTPPAQPRSSHRPHLHVNLSLPDPLVDQSHCIQTLP